MLCASRSRGNRHGQPVYSLHENVARLSSRAPNISHIREGARESEGEGKGRERERVN